MNHMTCLMCQRQLLLKHDIAVCLDARVEQKECKHFVSQRFH